MNEHKVCLIGIIVSITSIVLIFLYNQRYIPKFLLDEGCSTTSEIWEKYDILFKVGRHPRSLMRLLAYMGQCTSFGYLFFLTKRTRVFSNWFYIASMIMNVTVTIWLWTYSTEKLMESLVLVKILVVAAQYKFIHACLRGMPKDCNSSRTKFRWFILESLGITMLYSTWTVVLSAAGAFTYSYSFGVEVPRPGIFSSTTSNLIAISYFAIFQIAWTVFDLWLYPQCTRDIWLIYPGIICIMSSMLHESYDPAKGLTSPLTVSVALIVMAFAAMWHKVTTSKPAGKDKAS